MKYVIELPEYIKHEVDMEEDVDKAEDFIKWYSATLTCAIKDSTPLQEKLEGIIKEIEAIKDFEVINGGLYVRQYEVVKILDKDKEQAEEHQKQKEREFAIAELEKVKGRIQAIFLKSGSIIKIIDREISELKGENNES